MGLPFQFVNPASIRGIVMSRSKMTLNQCTRALRRCLYWAIYVPIAPALFLLCAVEDFAANVILPKEDRFTGTDEGY
jgi:hypothetical protein